MAERILPSGVQPRRASSAVRLAAPAVALVALVALAAAALLAGGRVAHGDGGERVRYDDGAVLVPAGPVFPLPLAIDFFTDDLGPPAAVWPASAVPVEFCTFHNNRPAAIAAEQFRQAMRDVAAAWNAVEAAVGIRYAGDCAGGFRWEFDNDRNEVGFDDARNAAGGAEAGLARGVWFEFPAVGPVLSREFVEFDVVLAGNELSNVPFICFVSVLSHEFGHTLGLGHSDTKGDLMFESFTPSRIETCPTAPSAAERARLQDLYGVDRAPSVNAGADRAVDTGAAVTLTARGSDPEGRPLTFEWVQLSGAAVQTSASGADISFATPSEAGVTLVFEVTALDPFLHAATDTVSVTVGAATSPPALPPGFASFLPGPAGGAEIGWTEASGASRYEFCHRAPGVPASVSCSNLPAPLAAITWDVTLGTQGPATATRVLTGAERETSLRACNSKGCTSASPGPLAGGLRWPAWGIDYDYFAMAFDFGRLRFTLVGVVNVSGPNRVFNLLTGPADDPGLHRIRGCGQVPAGRICIAFLGLDDEHFEVVSIVSKRSGTPTTDHRIAIR